MNGQCESQRAFVILGASGGIGSCVAAQLKQAGHGVLLASRGSDRLDQLAAELDSPTVEINATNLDEVEGCFAKAVETYGRIDGAVNCVGSVLLKPAHMTSEAEWHETIATNLTSAFATVRAAAKTMRNGGGSVVLMSSAAGRIGLASHEAIAGAKAGIIGLAQSAAASYAMRDLRFNVVAPGLVKTKLTQKIWQSERGAATSLAMHALGRLGEPEQVASLITWLLDPTNSWMTGEVFSIDGYSPKQPLPFSHKLHAGTLKMDCRYCHTTVDKAAHAAVPATQTCVNCHSASNPDGSVANSVIHTNSEKLLGVRESQATGEPIEWERIHDLPDYVYFDHSVHVNRGVSCVSCHGRVDKMEQVYQAEPLSMSWCLDSHRKPEPHLRPQEFITKLDWESAENPHELGARIREELNINPSTNCSTCHR